MQKSIGIVRKYIVDEMIKLTDSKVEELRKLNIGKECCNPEAYGIEEMLLSVAEIHKI